MHINQPAPKLFFLLFLYCSGPSLARAQTPDSVEILAQHPSAYWRFGETSSQATALDSSGSLSHGVYVGGVAMGAVGVSKDGDTSMAVNENGGMQVNGLPIKRSFTALIWARSSTTLWNTHGWIWSSRSPNGLIIHPYLGSKKVTFYLIGNGGSTDFINVGSILVDDITRWHQYGLEYDASTETASAIFDGHVVSTIFTPVGRRDASATIHTLFGIDDGCCEPRLGSGALDEAILFDRALSPSEIAKIYSPVSRNPEPTGTITGCVMDSRNNYLKNVWVDAGNGKGGTTGASGCYSLTLPLGTYTLRPRLEGWTFGSSRYQDANYTVSIGNNIQSPAKNIRGWNLDPVVFVHGWNSNTAAFGATRRAVRDAGYYVVDDKNLETTTKYTPSFATNSRLVKSWIDEAKYNTGRDKVILYTHSMGGLVARSYIESSRYENDVSQLFTFGSPHSGLPWYHVLQCLYSMDAICEMTQPGMLIFNLLHPLRRGTDYHLVAGEAPMWTTKKGCFRIFWWKICISIPWPDFSFRNGLGWLAGALIPGPDDGTVGTSSALGFGITGPGRGFDRNIDFYITREVHSTSVGNRDYFTWDRDFSKEGFWQCAKKILVDRNTRTCGFRFFGLRPSAAELTRNSVIGNQHFSEPSEAPPLAQSSRTEQSTLQANENKTIPVSIEGGKIAFSANWTEGPVEFSLIDPTGKIFDPNYAASIMGSSNDPDMAESDEISPDIVIYSHGDNTATYYVPAARPGRWQLILKGGKNLPSSGTSVTTFASFDSTLLAEFSSDRSFYAPSDSANFSITLSEPVKDAQAQLQLTRFGGVSETIALTRVGETEYKAKHPMAGASGYMSLTWSITGRRATGVLFERGGVSLVQVQSTALRLGRNHHDRAIPRADIPGLNSALSVTLEVDSDYADASMGVFAELVSADGTIVSTALVSVPAQRGANTVELRFPADDIYRAHLNGPYTLRNVRLVDERGTPLLSQEKLAAHTTNAYRYAEFAPQIGTPSVFVEGPFRVRVGESITVTATGVDPEGETLSYAWDLDGNGEFELSGQSVTFVTVSSEAAGLKPVRVRVTDPTGASAEAKTEVEVFASTENRPPVARCRPVIVPSNLACGSDDSVNDGSYDLDANDPVVCVQTPRGPHPVGAQNVTLTCRDSHGASSSCQADVTTVMSGKTTLQLLGESDPVLECGRDVWSDPGAQAWGACGPLEVHRYNSGSDTYGPGPNTHAEGLYPVQYIAWDDKGTTVSAVRRVRVFDRTPPVLKLKGAASLTHTCGSAWVDPGVEAIDGCYGDVTPTVTKKGYVNGWSAGTYSITYNLRDSAKNSALPVVRTVKVINCPW